MRNLKGDLDWILLVCLSLVSFSFGVALGLFLLNLGARWVTPPIF